MGLTEWIRVFFGFAPDPRPAEGFLSAQHLVFVSVMLLITVLLALRTAKLTRGKDFLERIRPLGTAACAILFLEGLKAVIVCTRGKGLVELRGILPLFLCSVMLFALPLAAFAKGRVRSAALDFSLCFGPLCANSQCGAIKENKQGG